MSVASTRHPVSGSSSLRFPTPDEGKGGGDFWTGRCDTINSPEEFRGNHFRPIGRLDSEGPTYPPLLDIHDRDIRDQILRLSVLEVNLCFGEFSQRNLVEELHAALRSEKPDIPELSRLEQFLVEQTLTNLSKIPNPDLQGRQVLVGAIDSAELCDAATFNDLMCCLTHSFENWKSVAGELERRSAGWDESDPTQQKAMIDRVLRAFTELGEAVTLDRFKLIYPFVGLFNAIPRVEVVPVIGLMLNGEFPFNWENHKNWAAAIRERQESN